MKTFKGVWLVGLGFGLLLSACQPVNVPAQATQAGLPRPVNSAVPERSLLPTASLAALPNTPPAQTAPEQATASATVLPGNSSEDLAMDVVPIPTPFDAVTEAVVTQARDDLVRRLSVAAADIELVEASTVSWPDSSLGCPRPGMMYAQIVVEGLRLRFRVQGKLYSDHAGRNSPPFLCESDR